VTRRIPLHFAAAFSVAAIVVALAIAVVAAKPAQALPSYKSTCSSCHSATPSGTVTATPSKTTVAPGEAYTVAVAVNLTAGGKAGWWLANDAGTPAVSLAGGPGTSPFTANMTAPAAAGTYTYKVWGAKGTPGSGGQALSTTYQVTVKSAPPVGDTTAPVTSASGAAENAWYKGSVNVTLHATDATGVNHIAYTLDGTPGTIAGASGQVAVTGDGAHTLTYQAVDSASPANTEALKTLHLNIDGVSPVAAVLANATVKKGAKATIKYQVADTPAGTAATTIKIKNKAGKVVKTLKATATIGAPQALKFKCTLAKGVYKVTAQATDKVGNVSAISGAKKLTVK
jgi:hypothetical protein